MGLAKLMEPVEHIVELMLEAVGKPRELGIISISVGLGLAKNKPGIFEEGENDGLTALLASYLLVKEHMIVLDGRMELVNVTYLLRCMDVCIGLHGMLGINIHDVLLELGPVLVRSHL